MLKETAYDFYINQNRSCSESIFMAACKEYQLDTSAHALKVLGAFSGGAFSGSLCGAVAGGAAAIALATGGLDVDAHSNPEMTEKIKAFVAAFQEKAGTELCRDIKPQWFAEGQRCWRTVEVAAELLAPYLENK